MNKDIKDIRFNIDLSTAVIVYKQYKDFFLPLGIIIASVVLFFLILIPQVQGVFKAQEEHKQETQKLMSLKQSFTNLSSMDENVLSESSNNLDRALPGKKDFAGIINSISSNSIKTGVTVGNFEFSLGDLNETRQTISYPSITISINVIGTPRATIEFIKSLYKSVPLCEITSIKLSGDGAALKMAFFYKTYPQVNLQNVLDINSFSKADNQLITEINGWADDVSADLLPISLGTDLDASLSSRVNPFQ